MCGGGGIGRIISNPITQILSDVVASATGNPELIPIINAGETTAGNLASGQSIGRSLGQGALSGGLSLGAQELGGALGLGNGNSLFSSGLTNAGNSIGGIFGDPTLGTDLANFSPSSGLSQLFGGTAAPTGDLSAAYSGIDSAPADAGATAFGAQDPANFAAGGSFGGGTPGVAASTYAAPGATGGAALGGGAPAAVGNIAPLGNDTGLASSQAGTPFSGFGSTDSAFGTGISPFASSAPSLGETGTNIGGINIPGITSPPALNGGYGIEQGGSTLSNLYGNITGSPNIPSGSFNYDFNGAPVGASALPAGDTSTLSLGGNSMFGGSNAGGNTVGNINLLNGLLRGGLGALLSNNNNSGYNAEIGAGNQTAANYQPFLQTGQAANNELSNLFGLNGAGAQTTAQQNWANTPGYQFALNQGLNALNADAAAKGQTLSGNNQQAVQQYGTGLANQYYNQYLNNLQNEQAAGLNAAGGVSSGLNTAAAGQYGKSGNQANTQNAGIGTMLNALFPSNTLNLASLFGLNQNPNSGVLSYL